MPRARHTHFTQARLVERLGFYMFGAVSAEMMVSGALLNAHRSTMAFEI